MAGGTVAKIDWEKARAASRARRDAAEAATVTPAEARRRGTRQAALAAFVEQHGLRCFKCGAGDAEWAKTGISKRGPWAICVPCATGTDAPRAAKARAAARPSRAQAEKTAAGRTKLPCLATITIPDGTYEVEVTETEFRFVRWLDRG